MRKASSTSKLSSALPSSGSWPSLSTSHEAHGGKHFNQRRVHFKELGRDDGDDDDYDGASLPVYNDYDAMKKRRGFMARRGSQITWLLWILIRAAVFVSGCIFLIHIASCGMFFCYRIPITNLIPEQFFSSMEYVPVTRSPLSNIHSRFSAPYYHTSQISGGVGAGWMARWPTASGDGRSSAEPMPKIVHQTYRDVESIPQKLRKSMESWKKMNRGWEFRFYSDQDVIEFVQKEFPQYLDAFNSLSKIVERTDFFRYMVLLKHGGVYADLDTECTRSLDSIIQPEDDVIVGLESMSPSSEYAFKHHFVRSIQMLQWVIISKPDHPILRSVCDHIARNADTVFSNNTNIDTLMRTGPGPWTDAVLQFIDERKEKNYNGTLGMDNLEYMQHRVRILPRVVFGLNENHRDDARLLKDKRVVVVHHFSGSWKSIWGWSKTPAFIKFFSGLAGYLTTAAPPPATTTGSAAALPSSPTGKNETAIGTSNAKVRAPVPVPAAHMKDDDRDINTVLLHDVTHNGYVVSADSVTPFDIFVDRPGRDMLDIGDGRRRHTDASSVISTCGSFEAGMEAGQACPKGLSLLSIFIAAMDDFVRATNGLGNGFGSSFGGVGDVGTNEKRSPRSSTSGTNADGIVLGASSEAERIKTSALTGDDAGTDGGKNRREVYVGTDVGQGGEDIVEGLFVDVGAGLGYYSLGIAARGSKVVAFEPAGRQHDLFQQSIDFNRLRDYVEVKDAVLGRPVNSACNEPADLVDVRKAGRKGGVLASSSSDANATTALTTTESADSPCQRQDLDNVVLRDGSILGSLASVGDGMGLDKGSSGYGAHVWRKTSGHEGNKGDAARFGEQQETAKDLKTRSMNSTALVSAPPNLAATSAGAEHMRGGMSNGGSLMQYTPRRKRQRIVAMRIGAFEQLLAILDGANSIFTSNNVDVVMTDEADAHNGESFQSQGPPLYVSVELIPSLLRDDNIDAKTLLWRMYDLHYTEIAHKGHVCSARWKSIRFRQAFNNYKFTPIQYNNNKAKVRFSSSSAKGADGDSSEFSSSADDDGDPWCKLDPDAFYLIDRWGHSTRPEVILFRYTGGRDKTSW